MRAVSCLCAMLAVIVHSSARELGEPLAASVVYLPTPVRGDDGITRLAYELHVTNMLTEPLTVARVEVSDSAGLLQAMDRDELAQSFRPFGVASEHWRQRPDANRLTLTAGMSGLIYLWVALPERRVAVKGALRHRISLEGGFNLGTGAAAGSSKRADAHPGVDEYSIDLLPLSLRSRPALRIGSPVRGGPWLMSNGPSNGSPHRRTAAPSNGSVAVWQRYAIDYIRLDRGGYRFAGDSHDNHSYFAEGEVAIAVADAVVVSVKDGIAANTEAMSVPHEMRASLDTMCGNGVVLDLGDRHYAVYCHLLPRVKVKPGERVRRGDVLGRIGNTGNSIQPHLHFQLADAAQFAMGQGLPHVFDRFEWAGRCPRAYPYNDPASPPCLLQPQQPRRDALPQNESIVFFP